MRGIGISTSNALAVLLFAAPLCTAQQTDYFPLIVGNQWIYRAAGDRPSEPYLHLRIARSAEFEGHRYWLLSGLTGDREGFWLRKDEQGNVLERDPDSGRETLWYDFSAPDGQEFQTGVPGEIKTAVLAGRRAEYQGPVGNYNYALEVLYPSPISRAVMREYFLPWIGMVHKTAFDTVQGLMRYDLVYARLGGVTYVVASELTTALSLDQSVYTANLMPPVDPDKAAPVMEARLTLRNTTRDPVELVFNSGQSFDLVIRNEKREIVYRWSDGKFFTEAIRTEKLEPPNELNFPIQVKLADRAGQPLPAGKYTAEAWLTVAGGEDRYRASTSFEVRQVF